MFKKTFAALLLVLSVADPGYCLNRGGSTSGPKADQQQNASCQWTLDDEARTVVGSVDQLGSSNDQSGAGDDQPDPADFVGSSPVSQAALLKKNLVEKNNIEPIQRKEDRGLNVDADDQQTEASEISCEAGDHQELTADQFLKPLMVRGGNSIGLLSTRSNQRLNLLQSANDAVSPHFQMINLLSR